MENSLANSNLQKNSTKNINDFISNMKNDDDLKEEQDNSNANSNNNK
jgi:hypothetical protein